MAKAKKKTVARKAATAAKRRSRTAAPLAAMPRSMQNRGGGDTRKAVQAPRPRAVTVREKMAEELTRITHETEVRGSTTRIERVVERAPKPSLPDVDRDSAGRGRYVYCIIRANVPL